MARIESFFLSLLYGVLLTVLYRDSVHPMFGYSGFVYYEPNWLLWAVSLFIVSLLAGLMPRAIQKPSDLLLWLTHVVVVVPLFTIPYLVTKQLSMTDYGLIQLIVLLSVLSLIGVGSFSVKLDNQIQFNKTFLLSIFFLFLSVLLVFVYTSYGFSIGKVLDIRNFADLYDIRYAYREQKAEVSAVIAYLMLWLANVLIPFLFIYGVHKKNKLLAFGALFLQVSLFAVSAHKSFVASLIMVYGVYVLLNRKNSGLLFMRAITAIVVLAAALFYLLDNHWLSTLLVRRVMMVPGMLSGFYFEFYSNNEYAYFAQSFMRNVIETVYSTSPAFTIGWNYFFKDSTSANANYFADAYANLGIIGIILVSVILNVVALICNALAKGERRFIVIPVLSVSFWALTQTSLNTALVSHGLGVALVLFIALNLIYRDRKSEKY